MSIQEQHMKKLACKFLLCCTFSWKAFLQRRSIVKGRNEAKERNTWQSEGQKDDNHTDSGALMKILVRPSWNWSWSMLTDRKRWRTPCFSSPRHDGQDSLVRIAYLRIGKCSRDKEFYPWLHRFGWGLFYIIWYSWTNFNVGVLPIQHFLPCIWFQYSVWIFLEPFFLMKGDMRPGISTKSHDWMNVNGHSGNTKVEYQKKKISA